MFSLCKQLNFVAIEIVKNFYTVFYSYALILALACCYCVIIIT